MSYGQAYPLERESSYGESMSAARAAFIRRTYAHLAGAVLAFVGLLYLFLQSEAIQVGVMRVLLASPYSWLIVMAAFIVFGNLAQYWASSQTSPGLQYLGLSVYVVLEAIIFIPILIVATYFAKDPNIIPTAGILTLAVFGGLTAVVFITKKDFSFLGSLLTICSFIALGTIIAAVIMGFSLGMFFCVAMITLMAGYILYDTSNVLHHYHEGQHVAAALALFASIATLFWFIIRLLLILSGGRD